MSLQSQRIPLTARTPAVCLWVAAILVVVLPAVPLACDVPVFRYALERWQPDTYQAVVFHEPGVAPALAETPGRFGKAAGEMPLPANLRVRLVDASEPLDKQDRTLLAADGRGRLPELVLLRPDPKGGANEVWRGGATVEAMDAVLQSPARTAIADRILDGQSAVFVLLESGNRSLDEAAAGLAANTLAQMPETLNLPPQTTGQEDSAAVQAGLRIEFSLLRISRGDPVEEQLIGMLLATEHDLADSDVPILLPVFGRGRVLYALVGNGINEANIRRACAFLVGPCACEIKADNPGADLLMSVDWAGRLRERIVDTEALDAISAASHYVEITGVNDRDTTHPGQQRMADEGPKPPGRSLAANLGIAVLAVLLTVATVTLVWWFRK